MHALGRIGLFGVSLAFCIGLAGCGDGAAENDTEAGFGSSAAAEAPISETATAQEGVSSAVGYESAFLGRWNIIGMETGGEVTTARDLSAMKAMGLDVVITLEADGTGTLDMFGEQMACAWEAVSATEGLMVLEGESVDLSIEGNRLVFKQGDDRLEFMHGAEANSNPATTGGDDAEGDLEIIEGGYDDANGKGYLASDGNYYFMNYDGTFEATDGLGNGVRDLDGDGVPDEITTDSGKTWRKL